MREEKDSCVRRDETGTFLDREVRLCYSYYYLKGLE